MNSLINNQKICLKEFVPSRVICKNVPEKSFELNINEDELYLSLSYITELHNWKGLVGEKHYSLLLPKQIGRNQETFEVLGLLQAEMGKQHDGKISFCNHEYKLINKVLEWFSEEFNFSKDKWKWYIKVNINEPIDEDYRREIENKVISFWIDKTNLTLERSYPKKVSFIKNTKNTELKSDDYGTLIIEVGSNLFSQIIKNFVKTMTQNMVDFGRSEVKHFMRGIIAGESCVEIHIPSKKYRIHISANDKDEKLIYHNCLKKLGINSTIYKHDKLVISRRENNLSLLKDGLMNLSPEKYEKFLIMMNLYADFDITDIPKEDSN